MLSSDWVWLLWLFPLAFAMGWFFSRLDSWQQRKNPDQAPRATFKGLSYLLNEQEDQAIDAFVQAIQSDPDASELHFALGNLFRKRGDYHRAIRLHEYLLSRSDLSKHDYHRAQHALALDFLKAGLLDRAEQAFKSLLSSRTYQKEALLALLKIHERSRHWSEAYQVAQTLMQDAQFSNEAFASRMAHFVCEQADMLYRDGDAASALALYVQAQQSCPHHVRACLGQARILELENQALEALKILLASAQTYLAYWPLIAPALGPLVLATGQKDRVLPLIEQAYQKQPHIDMLLALCALDPDSQQQRWLDHLQKQASLLITHQWFKTYSQLSLPEGIEQSLISFSRYERTYRCMTCGFESRSWFWQCPGCQSWDAFVIEDKK